MIRLRREKLSLKHLASIRSAFSLVWKSSPRLTTANAVLLVVQGLIPILILYLMKLTIDAVTEAVSAEAGAADFRGIVVLIALMGLAALFQSLCRMLSGIAGAIQSQTVTDHAIDIIHAKSVEVDLEFYENPAYHDDLHLAQREAPHRLVNVVNGLTDFSRSSISLIAVAGLLFSLNWIIALLLFAAVIPAGIVKFIYSEKIYRWHRDYAATERKASYLNSLLTRLDYAKEMRLFSLGGLIRKRFSRLRRKLRREKFRIVIRRGLMEFAAQSGAVAAIFASFAYIAYQCVRGVITVGSMVMFYQAFQRGQEYLKSTLTAFTSLYENSLFISGFNEFLALGNNVTEPAAPKPFPRPIREGIKFDRVSFGYPPGGKTVLEDVSFEVEPGEKIALVGANGAGKTTIIKLLCRFYDATSGSITVDGTDIREFSIPGLRREIGALFQDYARYNMTARENVWFGDISSSPARDKISSATRFSGLDEVIRGLPRGYNTLLGRMFRQGKELSIGEWQKLALARAFFRKSGILILDEPTSALDVRTEHEVFENFRELAEGKTVFFISHRLSTARMADRILVLDNGRIAESGSHEELLTLGGAYAALFSMQSEHYR